MSMQKIFQLITIVVGLSFLMILISHDEATAEYQGWTNPPSIDGRYFTSSEYGLIINGNGIHVKDDLTFDEPIALSLGSIATMKIIINDLDGWQDIRFVNLYMSSDGKGMHSRSIADTQIEFDHYGVDTVIDHGDFISNVDFTSQRYDPYNRYKLEVSFEFEFSDTLEKTDMIIYVIDKQGYSVQRYLTNVISVVEESIVEEEEFKAEPQVIEEVYEIPYWVKNNAKWWHERLIPNQDFIAGIEFMIKEGIIKIPLLDDQHKVKQTEIPDWIRTTAAWWSDDLVSDKEFVSALQFLIKAGIIKISNINEIIPQA